MRTKTMMAFTAAFALTTASAALAESWDPNPNDRNQGATAYSQRAMAPFASRPFASRQVRLVTSPRINLAEKQQFDRAAQPRAGGGK